MAGNQLVQSILVQFPQHRVPVHTISRVFTREQAEEAVSAAAAAGGIVVHTMVDQAVRAAVKELCRQRSVKEFDLLGELEDYLSNILGARPINKPGLYRQLNQKYFDRIEAVEFTVSCDDGQRPEQLKNADIIITGVSRTGKTPLSMYLSIFGWKVANVPIVKNVEPPQQLFEIDARRVFGLTVQADEIAVFRRKRLRSYTLTQTGGYQDSLEIEEELDYSRSVFRRGSFTVIDVSGKPVEATANEITATLAERFPSDPRMK